KPKILTCHTLYGVVNYHYIVGPRFYSFKNILNRMDVLHVLSSNDIAILRKLGIRKNKIVLIPPGISVNDFYASVERQGDKILFVGRISPEKDIETLLRALSKLKFDFKLQIIGPVQDRRYLSWLMVKFYEIFSSGKVEIIGPLSRDKLIKYYAEADLFVLPSKMETFALVLLEAMASKLPVITTNVGVANELIKNWENGFVVPVGDYKLLSDRIGIILKDDKMRIEMGERNRELVEEKYDLDKNFGKILALYHHLV
ncbi:MAG: glycosyltransferase family 4 protein, partial [Candidatus Omnitrophica bacterium]|nr:glycosyltransferase family 4 protein [Candidatus Omnitrophota bacterium]